MHKSSEALRLRRVHTLGQRARERRVHTRGGVLRAAMTRGAADGQRRDALGRRGRRTARSPHPRAGCGETSAEQETAEWSLPRAAVGDASVTHEVVRQRTRRRLPGGPGPGQWEGGLQQVADAGGFPDDLAVRDGGNDPQRPPLTPGAARHIERKHPLQQSCPAPARRPCVPLLLVLHPLLAGRGEDGPAQVAVRRQTTPIAHQMHAWQGRHERGQLFEQFHRREANPRGAIGPGMGEGVDEIAVGVLGQALQGHGTASGIADEPLQLIAPVRGDLGVGVQGKALDAGTAGTGTRRSLALGAKARANAPDLLAGPLAIGGRFALDKAQLEARFGPIEVDAVFAIPPGMA